LPATCLQLACNVLATCLHILTHFPLQLLHIRRYGCALNFDTGTHETYHKYVVNEPYAADCKREDGMEARLSREANTKSLVKTVLEERLPDPPPRARTIELKERLKNMPLGTYLHRNLMPNVADAILRSVNRSVALEAAVKQGWLQKVLNISHTAASVHFYNSVALCMHIACTLHAHCMHIACTLRATCMQLACNMHENCLHLTTYNVVAPSP